jgi:hypothetical protein
MNKKAMAKLKEYQEKVAAGEIERPKPMDPIEKAAANPKSLRAAINGKCYDCACGSKVEVARCEITKCTLHPVRPWQGMNANKNKRKQT